MTAVIDFFIEILERLGRFTGISGLFKKRDPFAEPQRRNILLRMVLLLWPLFIVFLLGYTGVMIYRFSFYRDMDMEYPERVLAASTQAPGEGQCPPSQMVNMQIALIDMMVEKNDWVPATPQYTIGFFGLVNWDDTPFFDNKSAFQRGMLTIVRRVSLDLADTLARVRGTSDADNDLQGAQSRLRVNERAWVLNNPFNPQLQTISTSASSSYFGAIELYRRYNERLADCNAVFDARNDNLLALFDRLAADLGAMAERLDARSQAMTYDATLDRFVQSAGNDRGWFDFRADNLFHEARGQLFALHGLMKAARIDFAGVEEQANLGAVWNRMEQHIAEGAVLNPLIVSNGREDGIFAPDHLSVMGEKVLRARANMTELRDILEN